VVLVPARTDWIAWLDPQRWGLAPGICHELAVRLQGVHSRYAPCFRTRTRDTSGYALLYMKGLLTMQQQRNYANIARSLLGPDADGQNLQQFMSDSPWSTEAVFRQVQADVKARPCLHGGTLTVDESGDERAGQQSAGAAHQYLGREGKTETGQVGVTLGYYKEGTWVMVDAELYLPRVWMDAEHAALRERWHVPAERRFLTKPQLAAQMILAAHANGLPFEVVSCDTTYGENEVFRATLDTAGILYIGDVPETTMVYLQEPPQDAGRDAPGAVLLRDLAKDPQTHWERVAVREAERGPLICLCAARRVWTRWADGSVHQEWAFLHRRADGKLKVSLSNAGADVELNWLAEGRANRYFAERIYQDAKSEAGWDELVARKYRAWMHHTALDAVVLWFIAETKLDWAENRPRDPVLAAELEVTSLPALSMANVRELLRVALPLPVLSEEEALRLVTRHLVHRSRSKASRLRRHRPNNTS
jgi:SRSO17 transposase